MFTKKLTDPSAEQPPKSWLSQKRSDLDLWWYVFRPDWVRTTEQFYWHHIRPIFAPQNRWVTKSVSRTYEDVDTIIESVLYAAVIHFVEGEKCFETTDWTHSEEVRRLGAELREVYAWAKTGRDEFAEKVRLSVSEISLDDFVHEKNVDWDEYNRLTTEFEEWDDRCLTWIVAQRNILWT